MNKPIAAAVALVTAMLGTATAGHGPSDEQLQQAHQLCSARFTGVASPSTALIDADGKLLVLRRSSRSEPWFHDADAADWVMARWQPHSSVVVCMERPNRTAAELDVEMLHGDIWTTGRLTGERPLSEALLTWLRSTNADRPTVVSSARDRIGDGAEPHRVGNDVTPPRIVEQVKPVYPQEAKDARVQGIVILEAVIDARGVVQEVQVLRSHPSHPMLEQAAIDAVRQWRFEPGRLHGKPVAVYFTLTVNFTLR